MLRTLATIGVIAAASFAIQAANGLPGRMSLAPERADYAHASRFHFLQDHTNGVLTLGEGREGRVLIFGDSMMQNYIPALLALPMIAKAEVHVVSRGGCVMALEAVLVINGKPDTRCKNLRDAVTGIDGTFDRVIWTQKWLDGYDQRLRWERPDGRPVPAFPQGTASIDGWRDGVARTLDHFAARSDEVILIGPQIRVKGVNPMLRRIGPVAPLGSLEAALDDLITLPDPTRTEMEAGLRSLAAERPDIRYIDPADLVCPDGQCRLAVAPHSYFMDRIHHTRAATPFLQERFSTLLAD